MALTDNLVSYWKFDGNSTDSVGSNNGTDTSITYSTGNGKIGQGAGFTTSSYINFGDVLDFEYNQPFTKSFWIKTTDSTANKHLLSKQDSSTTFGPWIEINGGKIANWLYQSGGSIVKETTTTVNDGNWHHIVITWDGVNTSSAGLLCYIDGTSATFSTKSPNTGSVTQTMVNSTGFQINGRWNSANSTHAGALDEIGIWSRAISSTEITQLYNSGNGLTYPFGTKNSAFFQFF